MKVLFSKGCFSDVSIKKNITKVMLGRRKRLKFFIISNQTEKYNIRDSKQNNKQKQM